MQSRQELISADFKDIPLGDIIRVNMDFFENATKGYVGYINHAINQCGSQTEKTELGSFQNAIVAFDTERTAEPSASYQLKDFQERFEQLFDVAREVNNFVDRKITNSGRPTPFEVLTPGRIQQWELIESLSNMASALFEAAKQMNTLNIFQYPTPRASLDESWSSIQQHIDARAESIDEDMLSSNRAIFAQAMQSIGDFQRNWIDAVHQLPDDEIQTMKQMLLTITRTPEKPTHRAGPSFFGREDPVGTFSGKRLFDDEEDKKAPSSSPP